MKYLQSVWLTDSNNCVVNRIFVLIISVALLMSDFPVKYVARWITASGLYISISLFQPVDVLIIFNSGIPMNKSLAFFGFLTKTAISSHPFSYRYGINVLPTNPVAPVMRIFIFKMSKGFLQYLSYLPLLDREAVELYP